MEIKFSEIEPYPDPEFPHRVRIRVGGRYVGNLLRRGPSMLWETDGIFEYLNYVSCGPDFLHRLKDQVAGLFVHTPNRDQ